MNSDYYVNSVLTAHQPIYTLNHSLSYRNELVTNLRAGNDSVSVIKLNQPYDMMVDLAEISTGRGERTRTSDLAVPNRAR